MVQRRNALQAWAELSCGFMGRSPDHLASALVGQRIGLDVFKKHSEARAKAFADYFEEASRNDCSSAKTELTLRLEETD